MKKIAYLAWNDIKIELQERWTFVFFLLLPVVFTTIIGLGLRDQWTDSSSDARLPIMVINADRGQYSAMLLDLIGSSDTLRPILLDPSEAETRLQENTISTLLEIPSDFSTSVADGGKTTITLITDGQDSTLTLLQQSMSTLVEKANIQISTARESVTLAEEFRSFSTQEERAAYFSKSLKEAEGSLANPAVKAVTVTGTSPDRVHISQGFEQSSPGQLVTWVLVTLLGGSEVFVNERLGGTLRRLLITPTSRGVILLGKIAGRLALGLLQMTILIGFGAIILNVNWGKSYPALALVMISFGFAGTSLGVMLGAFAKTRSQAANLSVLFSMVLSAVGGAWWPMEITPPAFQSVARILPSTWAMLGLKDIIVRGQGIAGVLPEAGVLFAFSIIFFWIGFFKMRLE